jgi:SAM-dependent methyltransferase
MGKMYAAMVDLETVVEEKDYLGLHLRDLPYFRALLRAVEARFYREIDLPGPVLDLGCGDGHFASIAFDQPLDVGIDPQWKSLREAADRNAYNDLVLSGGDARPFENESYASAVSNSVLEHIVGVDPVLKEIQRVLKPGAPFVFCVPNHNFLGNLSIGKALDSAKLGRLGDQYRVFFDKISRHYHCDPPDVWLARLDAAGFSQDSCWNYFSPRALKIFEYGHFLGLPSLISKTLFNRWILIQRKWNLALVRRYTQASYLQDPICSDGSYTFYVTTRI